MEIVKIAVKEDVLKLELGQEISEDKSGTIGGIELDIESQPYFVDMVTAVFEENVSPVHVIVDLKNVTYIDSSGLWALFEGHKKAQQKNGRLVLLNPSKDVKRVLDITKMSSKLDIYDSEDKAIKSFAL
jgi:anti-anti-sigma factor